MEFQSKACSSTLQDCRTLSLQALSELLPSVAQQKLEQGGMLILRPDSGDPLEAVLMALEAAEKVFGVDVNSKGYKVPKGCSIIYGDSVTLDVMKDILEAILDRGFSAEVVYLAQYVMIKFVIIMAIKKLRSFALTT